MYDTPDHQTPTAFWQQQVDAWQQSGQSQKQFCQDHQLIYHRFVYWRRKLDQDRVGHHNPGSGFATVKRQPPPHTGLSLALPNGLVVQGISTDNLSVVRPLLEQL